MVNVQGDAKGIQAISGHLAVSHRGRGRAGEPRPDGGAGLTGQVGGPDRAGGRTQPNAWTHPGGRAAGWGFRARAVALTPGPPERQAERLSITVPWGNLSKTAHHIGPDSAPDRYRLLRSIGRGGEAVLYLAEIELAGGTEPVVVKVLDSKTTITPEIFERISQKWNEQAELLRFVHRPGVVGVREHFQGPPIHRPGESATITGRALVLVMNHVDGLDLRDWRAERTSPPRRAARGDADPGAARGRPRLAALRKATPSGRTVVHGDLSPGNVMVDEYGQATLVDFGLSKLTADHQTAEVWFTPATRPPRSSTASAPRPPTGTPSAPSRTSCSAGSPRRPRPSSWSPRSARCRRSPGCRRNSATGS